MPKLKLNSTEIDRITPPQSGQVLYWDPNLVGFGLRVTKSSKSFVAQLRVNGETCRVKLGLYGRVEPHAARILARAALNEMASGVNPNRLKERQKIASVTLETAFRDFKNSRTLRSKTVAVYDSCMRRCFSDWLTKQMTDITKDMVESKHRSLSNANGPRGKGEAQAHQAMRLLRSIFNYAQLKYRGPEGENFLQSNPVSRISEIRAWNRINRRRSVIRSHQLKAWAKSVQNLSNHTVRDFLFLLLFTGLRRGEASSLRWSEVDFDSRILRIPGEITKNHQDHELPLPMVLVELLLERHSQSKGEFVFPGKCGCKALAEPKRQIQKVSLESGVTFMCHDLRRTFLSIAESLDIPHYALKKLANHRDSHDVTAGYIVNNVERLRKPMDLIATHLIELIGGKISTRKS